MHRRVSYKFCATAAGLKYNAAADAMVETPRERAEAAQKLQPPISMLSGPVLTVHRPFDHNPTPLQI